MASRPPLLPIAGDPDPNGQLGTPMPTTGLTAPVDPAALAPSAVAAPPTAMSQVRGPLGTHGTLGGILGIIGDIVLTQAGLPAQYLPKLQQAREADAIKDFASDPQGTLQNLTRVAGIDKGEGFYNSQIEDQYKNAQINTAKTANTVALAKLPGEVADATMKAVLPYRQLAGTATDKNAGAIASLIQQRLTAQGYNPADFAFPTSGSAEDLKAWANAAMTPAEQATAGYHNQRLTQIDAAQAETSRHNGIEEGIGASNAGSHALEAGSGAQLKTAQIAQMPGQQQERAAQTTALTSRAKYLDLLGARLAHRQALLNPGAPAPTPAPAPSGVNVQGILAKYGIK